MNGSNLNINGCEFYQASINTMITLTGTTTYLNMLNSILTNNVLGLPEPIIVFNQSGAGSPASRIINSTLWYNDNAGVKPDQVPVRYTSAFDTGVLYINVFFRNGDGAYALENTGAGTAFVTLGNVLAEGVNTRTGTFNVTAVNVVV